MEWMGHLRLIATWPLLPMALAQGLWLRGRVPRLPEAAGPREDTVAGIGVLLRLLVLGESTVAGVGAPAQEQALAAQLARALATRTGRAVQWQALGKNGVTAAATRVLLVRRLQPESWDAVVLVLGVNDTLALRGPGRWTSDLRRLIMAVRERTGPAPVFLAAVPPMGEFPALPAPLRTVLGVRARVLDRAAARLARQLPEVRHVPLPGRLEHDFFCHDGLHPSPAGYRAWAEYLAAAMADQSVG
jgi:lysophospholipase L1-like esterase